jgi:hypothetical protein
MNPHFTLSLQRRCCPLSGNEPDGFGSFLFKTGAMRFFSVFIFILVFSVQVFSQGFRDGEMEVRVQYKQQSEIQLLKSLKIQGDFFSTNGIFYVIPDELEQIKLLNLKYEILRTDLNAFAGTFWQTDNAYYSYPQMITLMDSLALSFPAICQKVILGTSAGGRELAILKISDNVAADENEPEIYFEGGIHGDELMGPELVIRLAREMILGYGSNTQYTNLINSREIWMFPLINPDGRVSVSRYNDNGVDVNRDWGFMWGGEGNSPSAYSQPETKADFEFLRDHQFVVYTSYHGGTEYISFPWSYRADLCPDFLAMNQFAGVYATTSGYANIPYGQGYTGMYAINGSTKDAVYGVMGTVPWSLEVSMEKQPPASDILYYYGLNKPAMLQIMSDAGKGIEGIITDSITGLPVRAAVFVNNGYPVYTDPELGDYHKYLLPGAYTLKIVANGYQPKTIAGIVVGGTGSVITNIQLSPQAGQYAHQVISCVIPGNNFSDEGFTPAAIGAPDNVNYSLGKGGEIVLDMQDDIPDGPGPDIMVTEGDATPEGYAVYAGSSITGPWMFIGNGNGTTTFDFNGSGIINARYIKLIDDNNGSATGNDAGFDLDALTAPTHPAATYLILAAYSFTEQNGNGNGHIDPGEDILVQYSLVNNGTLTATATTGLFSPLPAWVSIQNPAFIAGDILQGQNMASSFVMHIDNAAPMGSSFGISLDVAANSGSYSNLFMLNFVVGFQTETWESGTFTQFDWTMGGTVPWTITSSNPYQGTYCARSGAIGHNQSTDLWANFQVLSNDTISFYRKVSSEEDYDYLKFIIDGNVADQWSGTVAWGKVSYPVSAGNHTFLWRYIKDAGAVGGSDAAWIDQITFPPVFVPSQIMTATAVAVPSLICEGDSSQLMIMASGGSGNYTYQWAPAAGLNNLLVPDPKVGPPSTTTYFYTVSDGTTTFNGSLTVTVNVIPLVALSAQADTLCQNQATTLIGSPAGGTYSGTNVTTNLFTASAGLANAWNLVQYQFSGSNGCSRTVYDSIYVAFCVGIPESPAFENCCISPNPGKSHFTLSLTAQKAEETILHFIHPLGFEIDQQLIRIQSGKNEIDLHLPETEAGMYYLRFGNPPHERILKVLIQQ